MIPNNPDFAVCSSSSLSTPPLPGFPADEWCFNVALRKQKRWLSCVLRRFPTRETLYDVNKTTPAGTTRKGR